ncbi:MAG: FAD-binding oxidoreductase, partial [Candidatus Binataceae bacterium]
MISAAVLQDKLARSIDGDVRFDRGTLAVYSTDASNYRRVPIGVICPRHQGDVAAVLAIARENSVPILARGGGTSLAGQCANAALVLDFSKYMNSVGRIDREARTVEVEPGVVQAQLNAELAPYELFFAPDPSTKDRCTIGGMIGNNSCGAHSAAYGKTVDNLAALEVLLHDGTQLSLGGAMSDAALDVAIASGGRAGEIFKSLRSLRDRIGDRVRECYPPIPRRVSGYNLDELLPERGFNVARAVCGSEGTLAVTLRATLSLAPRPRYVALAILGFDDVFVAADQVPWMLAHRPDALEGFDDRLVVFGRIKGADGLRHLPDGRAFLIAELAGDTEAVARERAEALA